MIRSEDNLLSKSSIVFYFKRDKTSFFILFL